MVAAFECLLYGNHFAASGKIGLKDDIETRVPQKKINDKRKEKNTQ
jgi:hypothetical protein